MSRTKAKLTPQQVPIDALLPVVRFQIPSAKTGFDYKQCLEAILREFLAWNDSRNRPDSVCLDDDEGREGSLRYFYVTPERQIYCKLYWYDRPDDGQWMSWKGLLFREHLDQLWMTEWIHRLGERFETFLRERNISFERYGRLQNPDGEVLQSTTITTH